MYVVWLCVLNVPLTTVCIFCTNLTLTLCLHLSSVTEINLDNIDSNLLLSLLPVADLSTANFAYMDHDFPLSPLGNFADTMMVDDATLAQQQVISMVNGHWLAEAAFYYGENVGGFYML